MALAANRSGGALFPDCLAVILGAGDLASGVAYRLMKAGFPVVMTELPRPTMVRTTVSYGACVMHGAVIIEGVQARRVELADVPATLAEGVIPVLVDPDRSALPALKPTVVVDGRMTKVNLGLTRAAAPLVVALGPGFTAGVDCHVVIETNRGHMLGRALWHGTAEPDTGVPAPVNGKTADRVIRAPADGVITQARVIGSLILGGTVIARVGDVPVIAAFDGVLRGLIDDDVLVVRGMKIADLDPRLKREHCFTLSDKSLAIGGGVVEAVLSAPQIRERVYTSRYPSVNRSEV